VVVIKLLRPAAPDFASATAADPARHEISLYTRGLKHPHLAVALETFSTTIYGGIMMPYYGSVRRLS